MRVMSFNDKLLRNRVEEIHPKYIIMNPQTLNSFEIEWNGPYVNLPESFSFTASFPGVKFVALSEIPFGEVIFGVD
jgi:hypothetical protein